MAAILRVDLWLREASSMRSRRIVGAMLFLFVWPIVISAQVNHALLTQVLSEHVSRGAVDYPAIKADQRFAQYLAMLQKSDPSTIKEKHDRLAFWINVYNAFTIKLVNDHYPVKTIRDITRGDTGPWDIRWIEIGGALYSLNHVEHEIIRKEFDEPRIHFALVCAAVSCPPLRTEAYIGDRLDAQLEDNARMFLDDATKNRYDQDSQTLFLSELFSWYGDDFVKKHGSAVTYALRVLGLDGATPKAIKYLPYDWSLNRQ